MNKENLIYNFLSKHSVVVKDYIDETLKGLGRLDLSNVIYSDIASLSTQSDQEMAYIFQVLKISYCRFNEDNGNSEIRTEWRTLLEEIR